MAAVSFAELPPSQRQARIQTFLVDFDLEVAQRVDSMRLRLKETESRMRQTLALQLIRLPKRIKKMTVSEFQGVYGGDMEAVAAAQAKSAMDAVVEVTTASASSRKPKRNRKALNNMTNSPTSKGTVKRSARKKTTRTVSIAPPQAQRAVRRSTRAQSVLASQSGSFVTPAPRARGSKLVQATPAFDPRLPKTPFLRVPKRGESIMSMNGSPLSMGARTVRATAKQSIITLPLGNGKAIELATDSDVSQINSQLNKRARRQAVGKLQELQNQIASLMAQMEA